MNYCQKMVYQHSADSDVCLLDNVFVLDGSQYFAYNRGQEFSVNFIVALEQFRVAVF